MTNGEYQQLVEFLGQQFEAIHQRFAAIDQRFDTVDQRFEAVARRFDDMDRRFDTMQAQIDERFREVFGHFEEIYRRLERLETEYYSITQAIRRMEALLTDEKGRRELLERRLEELRRDVIALQARIEDLENRLHG